MPAFAGIQHVTSMNLDSRFRGNDNIAACDSM